MHPPRQACDKTSAAIGPISPYGSSRSRSKWQVPASAMSDEKVALYASLAPHDIESPGLAKGA